jgi:hypothetical protein
MVKITQGRKNPETGKRDPICTDMKSIKAHFDYLARHGDALEDESGNRIVGPQELLRLRDDWQYTGGYAIPAENGYRREAFGIVLSMPPGTDSTAVLDAGREFARENFSNHQYVFAQHQNEPHPHVHLSVKAVSRDLVRLNPRKADLQQWREDFAEKLRDHGIEANATSRVLRGHSQRPERQTVRHIEKRLGESRTRKARYGAARREAAGGARVEHPAERRIKESRRKVITGFGEVAKVLAASPDRDDRKLALGLARHVGTMKPPKTAHRVLVDEMLGRVEQGRAVAPRERDNSKQR